jgi:2-methylaconitate cis-trans-isomerase PrpF
LNDGRKVRCSLVDAATPAVFVQACDIGLTGTELPADTQTNPQILALMEELRTKAAVLMKLAHGPAVPKVGIVAAPRNYQTSTGKSVAAADCDLLARTKALVVQEVADPRVQTGTVRIGHPSGVSSFLVSVSKTDSGEFELTKSATAGTARRIMDGYVYV